MSRGVACALALAAAGCNRRAPGPLRTGAVEVRLLAHDTRWEATVDAGAGTWPSGREVHVPLGADVTLALASRDYVSIFSVPGLGLRDFAAPGLPQTLRFTASRAGRYAVEGDELCGRPHDERSRGVLVVEDEGAFRSWAGRVAP